MEISAGISKQKVKRFNFPAGEVSVRLMEMGPEANEVKVKAQLKNSDDILSLMMLSDAIDREYPQSHKHLKLNYVPYARQDRVCNKGESLSIAVFAKMLNMCNWASVEILDPHSDVTPALINNIKVKESFEVFKKPLYDYHIVAPDAGAYKKAFKWAERKQAKGVICANKVRDVKTGNILGLSVNESVEGMKLLVVDDILDGGKTFIELAKALKGYTSLELFVTHGIFTKGFNGLTEDYNHIYTTTSFHGIVPEELKHDKITWIDV